MPEEAIRDALEAGVASLDLFRPHRPDLASPPSWRAWRLPAPPPREDVIRDCACGDRPRDHMLVRVGTLVALAECMDCECEWFDEVEM